MWRNNVASGRGKFFHIDGDVYDGKISGFIYTSYPAWILEGV
jgi:hypothetical protein